MIPLELAPEPATFNERVRGPGLRAIAEMTGTSPPVPRRAGRPHEQKAERVDDLPTSEFPPYWREILPDLRAAYHGCCAYLATYIEPIGNPTVDHARPKSVARELVYEWTNYRLCVARVNAVKGERTDVVDPVDIGPGWFSLDLDTFYVERGPEAPEHAWGRVDATLSLLNLSDCTAQRAEYVTSYFEGGITWDYLERRTPFVAGELRRQGRLRPQDG